MLNRVQVQIVHTGNSLISTPLERKYEINNLWRLELPDGWRALYTTASKSAEKPKVSILRIMSHRITTDSWATRHPSAFNRNQPPRSEILRLSSRSTDQSSPETTHSEKFSSRNYVRSGRTAPRLLGVELGVPASIFENVGHHLIL